ncbi:autotransporter domain-containing protein [Stieleria sp.]|uniref:autotransporter family protein n=1 Tax=Stieleria sp. TaxID=2795976 RepID=UPI003567F86A
MSPLPSIGDLSFAKKDPADTYTVTIDRNAFPALEFATGSIDPTGIVVTNTPVPATVDINVATGVTLYGDGTVTGDIDLPGTLAPGESANAGSIGTFEVVGDLDLTDATVQIDLSTSGGTTTNDLIRVNGNATLTDATLSFNFVGSQFEVGQKFLILDSSSGFASSFSNQSDSFAIPDRPFLELVEDSSPTSPSGYTSLGNQLGFTVQDNNVPFSSIVTGCNQLSAVAILESFRGAGPSGTTSQPAVKALVNSSGESMIAAVNQLSGSIYPSLIGAEITHIQNNLESVRDRVMLQRYPGVQPPAIMPWIRAYGVSATTDQDDCSTVGYHQEFGGMELGLALSNKQGFSSHAFAHLGGGDVRTSGVDQRAEIESYRGGGSIEYVGDSIYVLAAGGAGVQSYDVKRSLSALEGSTFVQSSFDGAAQFGYFESGTVVSWLATNWIPYLGLHATRVELDPINETGDGDFALANSGGDGDSIRGVLGLGLEQSGGTPLGPATTRVRFGWMHEYLDSNEVFVSNVTGSMLPLTDRGVDAGIDWGFLRVQLDLFRFLGGQSSIAYQGQANSRSSFNALAAGVQWVR